jgi:hypothetical protein
MSDENERDRVPVELAPDEPAHGPWRVYGADVSVPGYDVLQGIVSDRWTGVTLGRDVPRPADLALAAAAPDLRDAVQAAIDEFAIGNFNAARRQRVVEFLRKSLAKAEGSR